MKKLLTTLILVLATAAALLAQSPDRSILKLRLSDGAPLSVTIDGRRWDRQSSTITVRDLPAGRHRIQVYRVASNEAGSGRRIRASLVYTGTLRLRPETINTCTIDVVRGVIGMRTKPLDADPQDGGYSYDSDHGHDNDHNGAGNNTSGSGNNYNRGEDYDRDYGDNQNGGYSSARAFTSRDMDDLRTRVAQRITDTDKESLLKTALNGRSCTTVQVAEMLKLLSFDSTRLGFAKWAYSYVSDRSNYWKLESAFSFSSSKEEFSNYIRSAR